MAGAAIEITPARFALYFKGRHNTQRNRITNIGLATQSRGWLGGYEDMNFRRDEPMGTICIKTTDYIEAEALKLFLDEYGIPTVLAPFMDGIVSSIGSESRFYSLLVLRQYLPQVVTALQEDENDLITPDELAGLVQQLSGSEKS